MDGVVSRQPSAVRGQERDDVARSVSAMVTIAPSPAGLQSARNEQLLEVRDLKTHFFTRKGVAKVLDGLSFHVGKGEIVGLVGESGSGKSVTGFSIVRLLKHPGRIVGGEVVFEGRDLTKLSEEEIQEIRGKQVSMIF
ncbi:MAG: peptide/nickel transport system ATP-binding protein, partial [Thermomicrobiales bacterium]|nr:peptide/nickel transport system ATP-binding protein [Thermomicrobiales bacterium]